MENTINKRICDFGKVSDIIQTIIIFLIALLVPTFLAQILSKIFGQNSAIATNSQLIVGSIVNAALVMTAINLKGWAKILGVVTMPSVSTVLSGYIFGTASIYMIYMIPAIWVGNFVLVYAYKYILLSKQKHYILAAIVGIVLKVIVIAGCFMILKSFGIFPEKLVTTLQKAMSLVQLITATIGSIIAFVIYQVEKRLCFDK